MSKRKFDYEKYGRLAWFSTLENAREINDFKKAALAEKELKRLGVTVNFQNKQASEQQSGEALELMEQGTPSKETPVFMLRRANVS